MTNKVSNREGMRRRQPTVVDVAAEAGVAVGTVSRYLNGHAIRGANRTQIEQAIEHLGYTRNAVAASMKTDTTHIVGLLVPSIGEFHAGLLEQISRKMRRTGRAVMSYCHDLDRKSILDGIEFFMTHRVDAVIMDGLTDISDQLHKMVESGLDVVLYDNDIAGLPADRVFVNNRQASRHAVEHLIQLGHTRIATVHGNQRDTAGRDRLAGYREALAAHELEEDPRLIVNGSWHEAEGYSAIRELVALDNPPTAVFSANYNMTIGILEWARDYGIRIPEALSLVTFDDVPAFSVHQPGITAIAQPIEALADTITTVLAARLEHPGARTHRRLTVNCNMMLRGSTRRFVPVD